MLSDGIMLEIRRGLMLVTCVSVGFVISAGPGLAARAAEPDRWASAIAADPSVTATPDDAGQRRIAELEQRVRELESERHAPEAGGKSPELAAIRARNEELAARNLALFLENQGLVQSRALEPSAASKPPSEADPRAQLRYWAKQIRDGETSFDRLSPEWSAAVNVLLRRERELDSQNPW